MIKRTVAKCLRCGVTVLCENFLFKRAGIYADSDRNISLTASVGNRLYPVIRTDIARIYTDFVNTCGTSLKRQFIIEMYVGNNRNSKRLL